MSLSGFVDEIKEREKTLTVFTAAEDEQLFDELEEFFGIQNITVRQGRVDPDGPQNFVVLHQEGNAVAVSTLEDVRNSLFLGGASSRIRGEMSLAEDESPDVINSLGNTTFSVDGDDRHLVTQISHYIQDLAHDAGDGVLHAGVQRLSNLDTSADSYELYSKIADAGVEVHVYGRPDATVSGDAVHVHSPDAEEVVTTRFAVFDGAGDDAMKAAMIAIGPEDGEYRGFWTFEASIVDDVREYLEGAYSVATTR